MAKVLMMWGGWNGHTPKEASEVLADALRGMDCQVDLSDSLSPLDDLAKVKSYDVIVPVWTMGNLTGDQSRNLLQAVRDGVGFAGFHGGAGDAFRGNLSYEWMVGGHFVGHPYVGDYSVELTGESSPITAGLAKSFAYNSEQYYMMIDPAIRVLATTIYKHEGQDVEMPVVWTNKWGAGKVFYSALGHVAEEFKTYPEVLEMTAKGVVWAAKS